MCNFFYFFQTGTQGINKLSIVLKLNWTLQIRNDEFIHFTQTKHKLMATMDKCDIYI